MKPWIPLIVYLCVQCITPGPNNLTCLYLGASRGLKGTSSFLAGSMSALFVKALLCGMFNLVLSSVLPATVTVLKWAGAAYMIYLAILMARSGWTDPEKEDDGKVFSGSTVRDGVMLQLLNGKSWIVSVSMFAVYVLPVSRRFSAVLFAVLLFVILAAVSSLIWAAFGAGLQKLIAGYRKPFGILMGLSLLWCAITALL